MRSGITLLVALFVSSLTASAEPYWIEWTGDTFPETEGWLRGHSDPEPERWLQDGSLFIDSREDWFISENYAWLCPGQMTPGPGETFVMQWRVKVHEIIGYSDPGVAIWSDDQHALTLSMGLDFIESAEEMTSAPYAPGEWHEFTLQSTNMLTYSLCIDGTPSLTGNFYESIISTPGHATWGDTSSHCSLAAWDYVGFGIVPEPSSGLTLCALVLGVLSRVRLARGSRRACAL